MNESQSMRHDTFANRSKTEGIVTDVRGSFGINPYIIVRKTPIA